MNLNVRAYYYNNISRGLIELILRKKITTGHGRRCRKYRFVFSLLGFFVYFFFFLVYTRPETVFVARGSLEKRSGVYEFFAYLRSIYYNILLCYCFYFSHPFLFFFYRLNLRVFYFRGKNGFL